MGTQELHYLNKDIVYKEVAVSTDFMLRYTTHLYPQGAKGHELEDPAAFLGCSCPATKPKLSSQQQ